MKKILALLAVLTLTLAACGGSSEAPQEDNENSETYAPTATALANEFLHLTDTSESATAESLAQEFLAAAELPFEAMTMPVEPGPLTGFGDVEITGFSEGVMFGPAISTIPFLGYVFQLEEGTDAAAFCTFLQEYADLRWNICTAAEEVMAVANNGYAFFLMCPSSLEG